MTSRVLVLLEQLNLTRVLCLNLQLLQVFVASLTRLILPDYNVVRDWSEELEAWMSNPRLTICLSLGLITVQQFAG